MKCLSIREPWCSLIMVGDKTVEFRTRKLLKAPETIAIATSKAGAGDWLPGGHIVGIARITSVVPWDNENEDMWYRACLDDMRDDYHDGGDGLEGFAYCISGMGAVKPVPVRGNVGLYEAPEGFEETREYADSPEQLARWYADLGVRIWQDGAELGEDDERARAAFMENGIGWRIDDFAQNGR